jgi:hypothetical protein
MAVVAVAVVMAAAVAAAAVVAVLVAAATDAVTVAPRLCAKTASEYCASFTASKNGTSKNSTKTTLAMPIKPSKLLLPHLRMKWCKVRTKECTDETEAFYQAWVPLTTYIITFGRQLNKQQKKCKNINVIILEEVKTLHFVGQMYKSNTTPKNK